MNNKSFPSHFVSNDEKDSYEYGRDVLSVITGQWFNAGTTTTMYDQHLTTFKTRRSYARGLQNNQKYKNELSNNGDLSWVNLDWRIVPVIPKFIDIITNKQANRLLDPRLEAVDEQANAVKKRVREEWEKDMLAREYLAEIKQATGHDGFVNPIEEVPETPEELDVKMLTFKQQIEIAGEKAVDTWFKYNDIDNLEHMYIKDQAELGVSVVTHRFVPGQGIVLEYVDPEEWIFEPTPDPFFKDCSYFAQVKYLHPTELARINPNLSDEDLKNIENGSSEFEATVRKRDESQVGGKVGVLFYYYKTSRDYNWKKKKGQGGFERVIKKDGNFNPPPTDNFEKIGTNLDVWYEGVAVLGYSKPIKWGLIKNLVRPKSAIHKCVPPFHAVAMRKHYSHIEAILDRMIPFADQIQLAHLKIQQVAQKINPSGVYLDADGLVGIDLGDGKKYGPMEAINMYFQTGSIIGRSYTSEGEFNQAKLPIKEINTSGAHDKIASLIKLYEYNLNNLRGVIGMNEATDASSPGKDALVGTQKIAAMNSSTALRHITQANIFIKKSLAESTILRCADVIEYSTDMRDEFIQMIGRNAVHLLDDISKLHLHSFACFIDVMPDEEERAKLEEDIAHEIKLGNLGTEDRMDILGSRNFKLGSQLLKIRKKKHQDRKMAEEQAKSQMQVQANKQSAEHASQARIMEEQTKGKLKVQQMALEEEIQKKIREDEHKKALALQEHKYQWEMKLRGITEQVKGQQQQSMEDRKDQRQAQQNTANSKMEEQKQNGGTATNFSTGSSVEAMLGE